MLLMLIALFGLMQLIIDSVSAGVVVERKIFQSVVCSRYCEIVFLALPIFSFNLAATLVKKILNVIWLGFLGVCFAVGGGGVG